MRNSLLFVVLLLAIFASCKNNNGVEINNQENNQEAEIVYTIPLLDSLIRVDSLNGDLFSRRAELHFDSGKYSEALFDINNAMNIKGENVQDLLVLSDVYYMLGNFQYANAAITAAERIDSEDYTVYYAYGKHNFRVGNFELAKLYFARSIQKHPLNPQSYFVLGQIAALEGDTANAISHYQNAIQADYEFNAAYLQLAVLNMDRNRELVPQYLQNAISVKPDNPYALFLLGVYHQDNEEYTEAKKYYLQSYPYDEKNKMTCFNLGYIYLTEELKFDSAALWLKRALALDPNFKEAQHNYKFANELLEGEK